MRSCRFSKTGEKFGNRKGVTETEKGSLHWLARVNQPMKPVELEALHESVRRGRPFGEAAWVEKTARKLGLGNTLRNPGRPSKPKPNEADREEDNQ
jgi:hypothetical protein